MELTFYQPLLWLSVLILLGAGYYLSLVDRPGKLKLASFLLRVLGVMLLVLSLCRPVVSIDSKDVHVVYILDVSESVDLKAARESVNTIQQGIESLSSGDSHSLFLVGNGVRSFEETREMGELLDKWMDGIADDAFRSASRLADAFLATRLSFPAGKARRIAVFTDGHETHKKLDDAIETLSKERIDVVWSKLAGLSKPEASVVSIEPSSPNAFEGEVVRMKIRIAANKEMPAKLRILHKGVAVQDKTVQLKPGRDNLEELDVDMSTPGDSLWTAELLPEEDHFPLNNQSRTTVRVRGRPRVLGLHQEPQEMREFERALAEQGFKLETRGENGLPESMDALLAFDGIILADISATKLSSRQMELLKSYVMDFGGGLAMFGSEDSFGLGGYYKTPVEEVLPLISRFEKEKEKPSLAMMLVIDKSGSMSGAPIALARQAAKAAVELLSPRDQVGIVGFSGEPHIISELRSAAEQDTLMSLIDTLEASGGTHAYPAMVEGKEMLDNAAAKIKHMIVLSDGHTQAADFQTLTQSMADSGITVSTVALGDADRALMAAIAEIGRGRYYETTDPTTVPQIFTKETMQASKSAIKEDVYATVQVGDHPMLSGYEGAELPFVLGYVMTEPKPTSQVILVAETGDPLLAIAQFGLGKGMAYSSDMTERWGGEWLASEEAGKFWAQSLRSILRKADSQGLATTEATTDGAWSIEIGRKADNGAPVSKIQWDAQALDSNGRSIPVEIEEVGLGRYRARIPLEGHDQLTLRLHDKGHDKLKILHYHRPYPNEYVLSAEVPAAIIALDAYSNGGLTEGVEPVPSRKSIAHWFSILGLLCLFTGIVLRRI